MPAKKKTDPKPVYVETMTPEMSNEPPPEVKATDWRDPDYKPADDDQGLEARMWRIAQRQQGKA